MNVRGKTKAEDDFIREQMVTRDEMSRHIQAARNNERSYGKSSQEIRELAESLVKFCWNEQSQTYILHEAHVHLLFPMLARELSRAKRNAKEAMREV